MKRMLETQQASEEQASTRTTRNRVTADVLSYLLERRTLPPTAEDPKDLAGQYGMDAEVLEEVAKHINYPSVLEKSIFRTVGKEGEERVTMKVWFNTVPSCLFSLIIAQAEWIEPLVKY